MIILPTHKIYGPDLNIVEFKPRIRNRYNGSNLLNLRDGGNDWYIYQPPIVGIDYDPETHKLDGIKYIEDIYVKEGIVALTPKEIAQREINNIDAELSALDMRATRGSEDLAEYLVTIGLTTVIPPELSATVAMKNQLRIDRAAFVEILNA